MPVTIRRREFTANDHKTSYLNAGPELGPTLIFVHGWPDIAETWKPQIETFASLGFHVVAPDCRGYGQSSVSSNASDYRIEVLVDDALALLSHLQREEAVWVGHDWGSSIVAGLAAHHPEVCRATAYLAVPYHSLEYGLDYLLSLINRDIYPADTHPNGPWDYQAFYERNPERAIKQYEANIANSVKAVHSKSDPANFGKPARTSKITNDGGWFGGTDAAPDIPLSRTVFAEDPDLYTTASDAMKRTGFFGATSYYLNHAANAAYAEKSINGGFLDMPSLFIEAQHDAVCATNLSRMAEPMRRYCRNLTECSVNAGHWLQLEKPADVNAALARVRMLSSTHLNALLFRTPLIQSLKC